MTMKPLSLGRRQPLKAVLSAVMLCTLSTGGPAFAQDGGAAGSGQGRGVGPMALQQAQQAQQAKAGAGQLSASDRRFVLDAAASGLFEVEAARMASSRAADPELQRYATMLVEDHTAAHEDLRRLASAKGLQLPGQPAGARQRALDRLSRLSGADFDHEFLRSVAMREHQRDIRSFQAASRVAQDPEIKAWAARVLPTLDKHLSQARQLPMMPMAGPGMNQGMGPGMVPGMGMGMGMGIGGPAIGRGSGDASPR